MTGYETKGTSNKTKNKQVGLHQMIKLMQSKRNDQQNKRHLQKLEENIGKITYMIRS